MIDEITAGTSSEDIAAALEAQAVTLRAQAERLCQLAARVRDQGLIATGRVAVSPELDAEAAVRDFLGDRLASYAELLEHTGLKPRRLNMVLDAFVTDGSVACAGGRGRDATYAWVFPDVADPKPKVAPRSENLVKADVARDAQMIETDRGKPVRLVDKQRTRRARSTPGVRHRHKMQDKAYAEQQAAKEKRAEEQRAKAKRAA